MKIKFSIYITNSSFHINRIKSYRSFTFFLVDIVKNSKAMVIAVFSFLYGSTISLTLNGNKLIIRMFIKNIVKNFVYIIFFKHFKINISVGVFVVIPFFFFWSIEYYISRADNGVSFFL